MNSTTAAILAGITLVAGILLAHTESGRATSLSLRPHPPATATAKPMPERPDPQSAPASPESR